MKSLLFLALFATVPLSAKPNIIYILADDLGFGDLSCYGQTQLVTPNLDRLAEEGIRFTRHYAGNTVCSPSRAVLMTGMHAANSPIRGNRDGALPNHLDTLPKLLKKAGYHTACIGKWGLGNDIPLNDPNSKGFDEFFGYVDMYHAHNFFPEFLIRNGEKEPLPNMLFNEWKEENRGNGIAEKQVVFAPHRLQEEVLSFLKSQPAKEEPFFLYYALNMPHANNEAGKMPPRGMEVPLGEDGNADYGKYAKESWPDQEKGFAQYITFIDNYVGEILASLDELGLAENTLVLFSSDNGPHAEGGHNPSHFDSNGDLRGIKRDLYEGGIRVPFIARWTGSIPAKRTTKFVCGFQDMIPTLCELAGTETPKTDGLSILPTLINEGNQPEHDYLYWEYSTGLEKGKIAILQNDWKLVAPFRKGKVVGPGELFKINKDPIETEDLTKIFGSKSKQLLDLIREIRKEDG